MDVRYFAQSRVLEDTHDALHRNSPGRQLILIASNQTRCFLGIA